MTEEQQEDFRTIGGRKYKSVMYDLEYGYMMEEVVLSIMGDTIGELFGVLDAADGSTPADALGALGSGQLGALAASAKSVDGDALGRAIGGLFRRLRGHGGFFNFAKAVLKNTKWITEQGEAKEVPFSMMRGRYADVEELVWWVLTHNFRSYFLERAAQIARLSGKESSDQLQAAPSASTKK